MKKDQTKFNSWKNVNGEDIVNKFDKIKSKGIPEGFEQFKEQVLWVCFCADQYIRNKSFVKAELILNKEKGILFDKKYINRYFNALNTIIELTDKDVVKNLNPLYIGGEQSLNVEQLSNALLAFNNGFKKLCSSYHNQKSWGLAGLMYHELSENKPRNRRPDYPIQLSLVYHLTFLFRCYTNKHEFYPPEPSPLAKEFGIDPLDGHGDQDRYYIPTECHKMPDYGDPCYEQVSEITNLLIPKPAGQPFSKFSVQQMIKDHPDCILTSWGLPL